MSRCCSGGSVRSSCVMRCHVVSWHLSCVMSTMFHVTFSSIFSIQIKPKLTPELYQYYITSELTHQTYSIPNIINIQFKFILEEERTPPTYTYVHMYNVLVIMKYSDQLFIWLSIFLYKFVSWQRWFATLQQKGAHDATFRKIYGIGSD